MRRSLVERRRLRRALLRLRGSRRVQELAVLVAVEFTGERRKLTSAARLARDAAAVAAVHGAMRMMRSDSIAG